MKLTDLQGGLENTSHQLHSYIVSLNVSMEEDETATLHSPEVELEDGGSIGSGPRRQTQVSGPDKRRYLLVCSFLGWRVFRLRCFSKPGILQREYLTKKIAI